MRKFLSLFVALILCLSLAVPACAVEKGFVPSITYKPDPELVLQKDAEGNEYFGVILDKNGEIVDHIGTGCLLVTPIAHVWDEDVVVIEEIETLLIETYDGLVDGTKLIPYDKHNAKLDPANMVVRDLFDMRWACDHGHETMFENYTLELTFDIGVVADAELYVTVYNSETGAWTPVDKTVNNGDGTITCAFNQLGVVAFSMPVNGTPDGSVTEPEGNDKTGFNIDLGALPWFIVLILAVCAAVVVGVVIAIAAAKKKKTKV